MTDVDVAVVGGGPAGCAAAIVLARGGLGVALVEGSADRAGRAGEALPPDIRLPLERLGAWDDFLAAGHVASPGILAAWGRPVPYSNDFILNPTAPAGWSTAPVSTACSSLSPTPQGRSSTGARR